jgi:hypothetical protein
LQIKQQNEQQRTVKTSAANKYLAPALIGGAAKMKRNTGWSLLVIINKNLN